MRSSRSRRGGSGSGKRAAEEELVKIEIDAAEALAEFSKSCLPESRFSQLRWLSKRRRSTRSSEKLKVVSNSAVDFPLRDDFQSEESDKEPRSGMPLVAYNRFETSDDSLDPVESPSSPLPGYSGYVKNDLGLVQHSAFKLDFDDEKPSRWGGKYRGKSDEVKRKRTPSFNKGTGSGRSTKALLTEEEKELRRIRRIEANRESARQTIRRKQKMCEEMTCKANELASENERMRKEIESVREETKRMSETRSSMRKQLETANFPPLTSSDGSGSDECSTGVINTEAQPEQIESSFKSSPGEPMIQQVQVNRQDDDIDSVEDFASPPTLELQRSCSSSSSVAAAGVLNNNNNNRPVTQGGYNPHFTTFTKMNRGFYPPQQQQQVVYSFYPGKSIAAENRRRRKELKQTRLYSRQVTLNT